MFPKTWWATSLGEFALTRTFKGHTGGQEAAAKK
jgi:ribosomal protein S19